MTITLKHYGATYSIETNADDLTATEVLEHFTKILLCAGWHQTSIDNAIMELN
jgi:hypothetical protein